MTSFRESRHVPTPAEHLDALQAALVAVAEPSLFALTEVVDVERFAACLQDQSAAATVEAWSAGGARVAGAATEDGAPLPEGCHTEWLVASVGFRGAFCGCVEMTLPEALASDLCASFTGLPAEEELSAQSVRDLAGEFTNMVCGSWLTTVCRSRRFDLSAPQVAPIASAEVAAQSTFGQSALDAIYVCVNDAPIRVPLTLTPYE